MKRTLALALLLTLGWACGGSPAPKLEATPQPKPEAKIEPKPEPAPAPAAKKPEPERIQVAHILISFAGTRTNAKRSKADAEKLAGDVLARAKKGEDFDKLMKDLSDDPGGGVYGLTNRGVRSAEGEYPRADMVAAFGDVGFQLGVGEIGMSTFDPKSSPFGWHIIKRLK